MYSWQRTVIELDKGSYRVYDLAEGPKIKYTIRNVGLYLVVEASFGLSVLWDRKTTIRILMEPEHSVSSSATVDLLFSIQMIEMQMWNPIEDNIHWIVSYFCDNITV